jgi:hypothetical protein
VSDEQTDWRVLHACVQVLDGHECVLDAKPITAYREQIEQRTKQATFDKAKQIVDQELAQFEVEFGARETASRKAVREELLREFEALGQAWMREEPTSAPQDLERVMLATELQEVVNRLRAKL